MSPHPLGEIRNHIESLTTQPPSDARTTLAIKTYDILSHATCVLGIRELVHAGLAHPYEDFPKIYALWQMLFDLVQQDPDLKQALIAAQRDPLTLQQRKDFLAAKASEAKQYGEAFLLEARKLLSARIGEVAQITTGDRLKDFLNAARKPHVPGTLEELERHIQEKSALIIFALETVLIPDLAQKIRTSRWAPIYLERYQAELEVLKTMSAQPLPPPSAPAPEPCIAAPIP